MNLALHRRIGTFRQLQIILAVADAGSVSAAAEALSLTQPTVSMQLKKLSDTVGLPLYDQVGRKLIFTDAGRAVLASAREIAGQLESLHATLTDLKGLKAGTLRLGMVTTSKYFVPHLLGDFTRLYPQINVEMKIANRQEIIERLLAGADDFSVLSHPPADDGVESYQFLPNPLVAIAPLSHPLSERGFISLEEFAEYPFLIREAGSGTRYAIDGLFAEHGITPNIHMLIDSSEAIRHAVMAGLGTSIVSSYTLAYGGHQGVVELQVNHLPITANWYFARLARKRLSVVATAFVDYVKTSGRDRVMSDFLKEFPNIDADSLAVPELP